MKHTRNPKKFKCDPVMDFFICRPLDHINVVTLPSDNVPHWEDVIDGSSGISILKLRKL